MRSNIKPSYSSLLALPKDILVDVLLPRLGTEDICSVAATCRHLRALALKEDTLWHQKFLRDFPGLSDLITEQTSPWIIGKSWRQHYVGVCKGQEFRAQVVHREIDNDAEDFMLSAYDAFCSLEKGKGPNTYIARYLPMGTSDAPLQETGILKERLRRPIMNADPYTVHREDLRGLKVGDQVELQWKARRDHPFGWWLGTIQEVSQNQIIIDFKQYPATSIWRTLAVPSSTAADNGETCLSYQGFFIGWVGGVRRLSMAEASGWAQHAKLICKRLQQAGDELAAVTPALSALMRNTEACAS